MPILTPAEKVTFELLDKWLKFSAKYNGMTGLQISVRKKGELIFNQAYGYANLEKKVPYKTNHIGQIASHSKLFTSCLALQLQENGLLNLTDPIVNYVPELAKHKDKRFKEITIRDLLNNRSGIFRDGVDSTFWDLEKPFLSREQLINEIMQANLVYDPNTYTKYSNIGVSLAGIVLERASGLEYNNLVYKLILNKFPSLKIEPDYGMTKGFSYSDGHTLRLYDDKRKTFPHMKANGMSPATGFCANTESISKFLHELYFGDKLLSKHNRRDMISMNWLVKNTTTEFYGIGTQFNLLDKRMFIGHSGGYHGFMSQTRYCLDTDYIISVIWNSMDAASLDVTRSVMGTLAKITETFTKAELPSVLVSEPMMSKWGAAFYLVSDKKVLRLFPEGWLLHDSAGIFDKRKDGLYYNDKLRGYVSVGEPLQVFKKGKTISKIKMGSTTMHSEKDYFSRDKKILK